MRTKDQVLEIVRRLEEAYPLAECTLDYKKNYELLFSVRLAAQCTDARVNEITPALFARFPTLQSFAEADVAEIEEYVHSCGFYRAKARDIVGAAQMILRDFGGRVPDNMDDLLKLPGVGRKTANLILGDVYHVPGSTVVDTHCIRISNRLGLGDLYAVPGWVVCDTHCIRICGKLGLSEGKEPEKVERQLRAILPPEESSDFCHRIVLHGRAVCTARKPDCESCTLRSVCQFAEQQG